MIARPPTRDTLAQEPAQKQWDRIADKVTSFGQLSHDWDEDAPLSREMIQAAPGFIRVHRATTIPPLLVYPHGDGTITFEWRIEGTVLRLEILGAGLGELMTTPPDSRTWFQELRWVDGHPNLPITGAAAP